jgi:hypothetical protein
LLSSYRIGKGSGKRLGWRPDIHFVIRDEHQDSARISMGSSYFESFAAVNERIGYLSTIECETRSSVLLPKLVLGTSLTERRISCTTIEFQARDELRPDLHFPKWDGTGCDTAIYN